MYSVAAVAERVSVKWLGRWETVACSSSVSSSGGTSLKNSATLRSSAVATLLSAVRPMEEIPLSTCERNPIESPE